MNKIFLITFLIAVSIFSCSQESKQNNDLDDCSKIKIMIEDCMDLHRGALGYLENCGSLELEQAKSYQTCDELLDHVGIYNR